MAIPKILMLMGPPGSGKGTQAKKLALKFGYRHLSSGDLVRAILADPQADPEEKKEAEKSRQGMLVADWLIYRLVFKEIEKELAVGRGVILDGAIRTVIQAQKFAGFFDKNNLWPEIRVIWIDLPDKEAWNRLTMRRMCSSCGELIPYLAETKDLDSCPKCGGSLLVRPDDASEVLKERFVQQGNEAQKSILDFFRWKTAGVEGAEERLIKADGRQSISEVFEEILRKIR